MVGPVYRLPDKAGGYGMKKSRIYQIVIAVVLVFSVAIVQWRPAYAVVAANAYIGALDPEITYSSDASVGFHGSGDPFVTATTATFTATGADRVVIPSVGTKCGFCERLA